MRAGDTVVFVNAYHVPGLYPPGFLEMGKSYKIETVRRGGLVLVGVPGLWRKDRFCLERDYRHIHPKLSELVDARLMDILMEFWTGQPYDCSTLQPTVPTYPWLGKGPSPEWLKTAMEGVFKK